MRRLAAVAILIIFAGIVSPIAASVQSCVNPKGDYTVGWNEHTTGIKSVIAGMDPDGTGIGFLPCGAYDPGFNPGWSTSSTWVAIVPNVGAGIIQFGLVYCDTPASGPANNFCFNGGHHPSVVFAKSGCNPTQTQIYLGTVPDWLEHKYKLVVRPSNHTVTAYYDGTALVVANTNDLDLFCWAENSNNRAQYFAERFNRGDSIGTWPAAEFHFTKMRFGFTEDGVTNGDVVMGNQCNADSDPGYLKCDGGFLGVGNGSNMNLWNEHYP